MSLGIQKYLKRRTDILLVLVFSWDFLRIRVIFDSHTKLMRQHEVKSVWYVKALNMLVLSYNYNPGSALRVKCMCLDTAQGVMLTSFSILLIATKTLWRQIETVHSRLHTQHVSSKIMMCFHFAVICDTQKHTRRSMSHIWAYCFVKWTSHRFIVEIIWTLSAVAVWQK